MDRLLLQLPGNSVESNSDLTVSAKPIPNPNSRNTEGRTETVDKVERDVIDGVDKTFNFSLRPV